MFLILLMSRPCQVFRYAYNNLLNSTQEELGLFLEAQLFSWAVPKNSKAQCFDPAHLADIVNAGEILQRLAGVKVQHGREQEGPRYRGPFCLPRFIPEGRRPTAILTGLGVPGAWSERA